jgi:hypothetical protein
MYNSEIWPSKNLKKTDKHNILAGLAKAPKMCLPFPKDSAS